MLTAAANRLLMMKSFALILFALLPAAAWADCSAIADTDQRAYCRAVRSDSPSRCVEIQDHALRQTCRVRLGDSPANCNTISNAGDRDRCRMEASES